jgi:hypothetical protein
MALLRAADEAHRLIGSILIGSILIGSKYFGDHIGVCRS